MAAENGPSRMSRRDFLRGAYRAGARIGVGLAAGEIFLHAGNGLNRGVERVTGHPAGNAIG